MVILCAIVETIGGCARIGHFVFEWFSLMLGNQFIQFYPQEDHNVLNVLPDFMPYGFSSRENYINYLAQLSLLNGGYLQVDGAGLKKVGWLGYAWQTFKGWIGLTNYCDKNWVSGSLQKLLYWGYSRSYNSNLSDDIERWRQDDLMTRSFCNWVQQERKKETSLKLQNQLTNHFTNNSYLYDSFLDWRREVLALYIDKNTIDPINPTNYRFGHCFYQSEHIRELIALDPQASNIRNKIIAHHNFKHYLPNDPYLRESYVDDLILKVRQIKSNQESLLSTISSFASYILGLPNESKVMLRMAYYLQPSIASQYPDLFIPFLKGEAKIKQAVSVLEHCYANNEDQGTQLLISNFGDVNDRIYIPPQSDLALKAAQYYMSISQSYFNQAIAMHQQVKYDYPAQSIPYYVEQQDFSTAYQVIKETEKSNPELALELLKSHFKTEQAIEAIESDTPIAKSFAKFWLDDRNVSKLSLKGITRWVKGYDISQHYIYAGMLNTEIAQENPTVYFDYYVNHHKWQKAYQLYIRVEKEQRETFFSAEQRAKVAEYFNEMGEGAYELGKQEKVLNKWQKAQTNYYFSLQQKIKALQLMPDNSEHLEEVAVHYRLFGQIKFDRALAENLNIDLSFCQSTLEYFEAAKNKWPQGYEDDGWIKPRAKIQRAMIPLLHKELLRSQLIDMDTSDKLRHLKQTIESALELLSILDELLNGYQEGKLTDISSTAYAHWNFLMAEVIKEYEIETYGAAKYYYQKAVDNAPNHPYYNMLLAEQIDGSTAQGIKERDGYYSNGIHELKSRGLGGVMGYMHWFDERWLIPEDRIYKLPLAESLKDVSQAPKKGWFSI